MNETPMTGLDAVVERDATGLLVVRGTRVDLQVIASAYRDGLSPEEIVFNYPSLSATQVYAAVAWYLANRALVDAVSEERAPPASGAEAPVVVRLRALADKLRHQAS